MAVINKVRYQPRIFGSTLRTKYVPRALGGVIILGAPLFIATEAMTVSDSVLFTASPIPVDATTASDITLSVGIALPIELNTASEGILSARTYLPLEANTISESGLDTQLYVHVDALTATDSSLTTDTTLPIDGLSANESLLATESVSFTEANTLSENLLDERNALSTEVNMIIEGMSNTGISLPTETLPVIAGYALRALNGTLIFYVPIDTLLDTQTFLPVEVDALSDSSTMISVHVATTIFMTFEDDLIVSDLGTMARWGIDTLGISESFMGIRTSVQTEAMNAIDALLGTVAYLPVEVGTVSESYTISQLFFFALTTKITQVTFRDGLVQIGSR